MEIPRAAEKNFSPQGSPAKSSSAILGLVIPGHRAAMNPESRDWFALIISRFRVWPCGPSLNDELNRSLPLGADLFGRALRGFGELGGNCCCLGRVAPARRIAAVAPIARPVEG